MSAARRRAALALALALPPAGTAAADPAPGAPASTGVAAPAAPEEKIDLRLTLSTFLFREGGGDAPPLVEMGAPAPSASPVQRYFGDLRLELTDGPFELDGRVRQTTSERYQAGASAGGEYELRKLSLRVGSERRALIVGRQVVDAVGATKIDGVAAVQRLSRAWSATLFGGAFPQLGSRSVDTDYPAIRAADGTSGQPLVPLAAGAGAAYTTGAIHGELGAAAVYVAQDVPGATSSEASRVFVTASGYSRLAQWLDVYHFGLLDVAGAAGAQLTNGSLGADAHPREGLRLSAAVHHVGIDVLQIAARNAVTEPDPTAIGIVQNNVAVVRVAQDEVRGGASVALARARFELSATGALHRRPRVDVALEGGGAAAFPEARSGTVTLGLLDRRSVAALRVAATATLLIPIGDALPNRSRGTIVRLSAGRAFAADRGQLEVDAMGERLRDLAGGGGCEMSLDPLACYGAATTTAAQLGALASFRVAREWLLLFDAHLGVRRVKSSSLDGAVDYPAATSVTTFARVQWRYR